MTEHDACGESPLPAIDMAETGKRIRRLRERAGLSVRELQQAMGLGSPQAVYKWERGETLPNLDNLVVLSRLLKASLEELLALRET